MGNNKIGIFSTDGWGNESHFIKIELDVTGGISFETMGTLQLVTVRYAFHSSSAEKLTGKLPEPDPVYSSSVSSGISEEDTTKWNHKLNSYSETDPLFSGWDKSYSDLSNKPDIKDSVLVYANGSETRLLAGENIEVTGEGNVFVKVLTI